MALKNSNKLFMVSTAAFKITLVEAVKRNILLRKVSVINLMLFLLQKGQQLLPFTP